MIEIDLESPSLLFIQQKTQPVIILRDRQCLVEQPIIPAVMIMRLDMDKIVVIAQRRLRNMDRAMRIEFTIVTPGCIYLL